MKRPTEPNSPEARERADLRLRRLTRSAVLAATGATALIGVVVAKEHPGSELDDSPGPDSDNVDSFISDDDADDGESDIGIEFGRRVLLNNSNHADADDHHDSSRRHVRRHIPPVAMTTLSIEAAQRSFRGIGTTATVAVLDPTLVDRAESILRTEIEAIDLACSRFRPDSELEHLHAVAGSTITVSPLLFEALEIAVSVAERTGGAVDPTVGNAVIALGYDCDFARIERRSAPDSHSLGPVVGFGHIHLDARRRSVRIPRGVRLDLGSSAKAFVTDRSASRIAGELHTGVLVSVGGDVAVAGPTPPGGWAIGIAVDSSTAGADVDQVVAIVQGGLASSSTAVRTWTVGEETVHHIIDPSTGHSAAPYWTLASATGASCVEANALTTAAIVWGPSALDRLRGFDQAVRLVRHDRAIFTLGGWPGEGSP